MVQSCSSVIDSCWLPRDDRGRRTHRILSRTYWPSIRVLSESLCKGCRGHFAFQPQGAEAGKRSSNRIANCPMAAIQSIGRRQRTPAFADGQEQQLCRRLVAGTTSPGLDDLAQGPVQALDGIGNRSVMSDSFHSKNSWLRSPGFFWRRGRIGKQLSQRHFLERRDAEDL